MAFSFGRQFPAALLDVAMRDSYGNDRMTSTVDLGEAIIIENRLCNKMSLRDFY